MKALHTRYEAILEGARQHEKGKEEGKDEGEAWSDVPFFVEAIMYSKEVRVYTESYLVHYSLYN